MENKYISVNGRKYSYYTEGSGDAVLYLCGFGAPYIVADFYPYVKALRDRNKIVLLERLGYGNSDDGAEFDLSDIINQIISAEDLNNITLAAH